MAKKKSFDGIVEESFNEGYYSAPVSPSIRTHLPAYTLEQLHRLAPGFPVFTDGEEHGWGLLDYKDGKLIAIRCLAEDGISAEYLREADYGAKWLAYPRDISPGEWD